MQQSRIERFCWKGHLSFKRNFIDYLAIQREHKDEFRGVQRVKEAQQTARNDELATCDSYVDNEAEDG